MASSLPPHDETPERMTIWSRIQGGNESGWAVGGSRCCPLCSARDPAACGQAAASSTSAGRCRATKHASSPWPAPFLRRPLRKSVPTPQPDVTSPKSPPPPPPALGLRQAAEHGAGHQPPVPEYRGHRRRRPLRGGEGPSRSRTHRSQGEVRAGGSPALTPVGPAAAAIPPPSSAPLACSRPGPQPRPLPDHAPSPAPRDPMMGIFDVMKIFNPHGLFFLSVTPSHSLILRTSDKLQNP
ncbi:uncharacterized protein isoform X1 [Castor canadensis]|uniref:Uncharacterized protein isoform X1 n=1 Tax=Castor canadensis TaxID=51338 RepID=A0AC58L3R0_CASCN